MSGEPCGDGGPIVENLDQTGGPNLDQTVGFRYINSKCCDFFTEALLFDARLQDNQICQQKNAEQEKNPCEKRSFKDVFLEFMDKFLIFEFLMLVKEVAKLVSQLANPTKKKRTPHKNHKNRLVLHVLFFKLVGQGPCGRVQKKVHKNHGYRNWTILGASAKEDSARELGSKQCDKIG